MKDFKAKLHQIRFRLGSVRPAPDPLGSLPLAVFGAASRQGEGCWGRGKREGREGKVEGREREGPQVTVEPGPLSEPCYATAEPPHFNHCL